jgi:glycosyltransferase involved in cell wall biosynthesis
MPENIANSSAPNATPNAVPTAAPKASVVLAVLNGEKTLRSALDSILAQTLRDFELLVVDDGSTDSTAAILSEYACRDLRVRVLSHEKNKGLAASLNDGIRAARSEFIIRADADDYNFPERFAKQIAFMEAHPETDVLGGAMERKNSAGEVFSITRQLETDAEIKRKLYLRVPFFHPTVLLRKSFWERNGGYDSRWRRCEDLDLWLRGYKKACYRNLPDVLVSYSAPTGVKTKHLLENFRMLLKNGLRNGDLPCVFLAIAKFSFANIWFRVFPSKYFSRK